MNTILLYNNALNLNLKQAMNDANDVLYNMQSLKQFQWNIDQIQKMKNGVQMQVNMAALALWRNFVLNEGDNGFWLFHNLIRKYYPLNDEQISKYETCSARYISRGKEYYYCTNVSLIQRKGESFSWGDDIMYSTNPRIGNYDKSVLRDLYYDAKSFDNVPYWQIWPDDVYRYSYNIDFLKETSRPEIIYVAQNRFTTWSWNLVNLLNGRLIKELLKNDGFFAQMGINNVRETLNHLQEVLGTSFEITEEMRNEVIARLEQKGIALYSYLPMTKDFIFQHQDELDWKVIQKNPRIQWDWELINLYLRKVKEAVSEDKRNEYLLGSKAMYTAVEDYLNDDILSDIEKLYGI
ncbi:hypothetical protein EVD33_15095 [Bacteroidales bacterium SW292]|nr:hypothetical protein [Bacteroidales bacterium SW292]